MTKKRIDLKCQKPFLCIYTGPVKMFVVNLAVIDWIVVSPAYRHILKKNFLSSGDPKIDIFTKISTSIFLQSLYFLYTVPTVVYGRKYWLKVKHDQIFGILTFKDFFGGINYFSHRTGLNFKLYAHLHLNNNVGTYKLF